MFCGIRDPGFRVQIKNQEVYIVGEVKGFQSRNRNLKLALIDMASHHKDLPDVDFVMGTYDWTATEVQSVPGMEEGGPVFAQVGGNVCSYRPTCASCYTLSSTDTHTSTLQPQDVPVAILQKVFVSDDTLWLPASPGCCRQSHAFTIDSRGHCKMCLLLMSWAEYLQCLCCTASIAIAALQPNHAVAVVLSCTVQPTFYMLSILVH